MVQSAPTAAPAPITTSGAMVVRAPMRARAPIDANGPIATPSPSSAVESIDANELIPAMAGARGVRIATASANARYGSEVRSIAHGATFTESLTMTADARVVASLAAYLGL